MASRLTPPVVQALQETHPDVQAQESLWDLYVHAPGLLDAAVFVRLAYAEGMTPEQITNARTTIQEN